VLENDHAPYVLNSYQTFRVDRGGRSQESSQVYYDDFGAYKAAILGCIADLSEKHANDI
jgi:hypothetical protein